MKSYSILGASILALLVAMPAFADDNLNTAHVDQIGTGLLAAITQDGAGNTSTIDVDQGLVGGGIDLSATVHQGGLDTTNEATIVQSNSDQTVLLDQHGASLTDNFASIIQDGVSNTADVLQNGTNNQSDLTLNQFGTGVLNSATVMQGGTDSINNAIINQNGGGLTANVTQN
jgi:hypothetical protein